MSQESPPLEQPMQLEVQAFWHVQHATYVVVRLFQSSSNSLSPHSPPWTPTPNPLVYRYKLAAKACMQAAHASVLQYSTSVLHSSPCT